MIPVGPLASEVDGQLTVYLKVWRFITETVRRRLIGDCIGAEYWRDGFYSRIR